MKTRFYLSMLTLVALTGCATEPTTVTTTTTTQEVTTTRPAREVVVTRGRHLRFALKLKRWHPGRGTSGQRVLAMDRHYLPVDAGYVGSAPTVYRSLGCGSLGAPLQRPGAGRRPLAIGAPDAIVANGFTSLTPWQKAAAQRSSRQIRSQTAEYRRSVFPT
jgi:hypothetical protein